MKVTYRKLANYLVSSLPCHSHQEFSSMVDQYVRAIEALPSEAKVSLKAAYIFSHTRNTLAIVPAEEREDLFQDLAIKVYEAQTKDDALAYTIARYDWFNWQKKRRIHRRIMNGSVISLNNLVLDADDQEVELVELLAGNCGFHDQIDSTLAAQKAFDALPGKIKAIVRKRLDREPLSDTERQRLSRYLRKNGTKIKAMLTA